MFGYVYPKYTPKGNFTGWLNPVCCGSIRKIPKMAR